MLSQRPERSAECRGLNMSGGLQSDVLAEETHSGGVWTLLMIPAMIGPVTALWLPHNQFVLWAALFAITIGVACAAVMWSGFQYRFLRHGVEIRMLRFRLRSIPRQSIVSYSIEPWAFIRGYGIRGIGSTRAYVWCNKVVHIRTSNGEVFLGHSDPERIVRDLDIVTGVLARC